MHASQFMKVYVFNFYVIAFRNTLFLFQIWDSTVLSQRRIKACKAQYSHLIALVSLTPTLSNYAKLQCMILISNVHVGVITLLFALLCLCKPSSFIC